MITDTQYQRWLRVSAPAEKCLLITLHNNTQPIYLSSTGYVSLPTDSLPNKPFRGCLTDLPEISDSGQIDVGDLEFSWPARVAELRSYHWRGYPYEILMGGKDWSYDDFRLIASGFIEKVVRSQRDRLRVDFAGAGLALEQPVAVDRVDDVLLPVCIGSVINISPVQPDTEQYVYYVSAGAVDSIDVRVDGVPVSPVIDLQAGKITFSADPEGTVTADVDVNASRTVQSSLEWLASRRGIDSPVFDWLTADQLSAEVGLYITGEDYYSSVMDYLADAVGAETTHDELGKLHVYYMDYQREADYTLVDDDMVRETLAEKDEVRELSAVTLRYGHNHNVQSDVTDFKNEWLEVHVDNPDNHYPADWLETLELEGALVNKADSEAELGRVAANRFVRRIIYSATLLLRGVLLRRGHRVRLNSKSWGLDVLATISAVERLPGSNRYVVECIA